MNNIILGAGFAGMAAGIKTGYPIYEATDQAGGICRNYVKDGYTFSNGGPHWVFGKGPGLEYIESLTSLKTYIRRASVYYNTFLPFPIQEFAEKDEDYLHGTFKHWLRSNFSKELCNMFFYPFNKKYTCGLYEETAQIDGYKTPIKGGEGTALKFHDPVISLSGLVDKMKEKCNIKYNRRAIKIDTDFKVIHFENGESLTYGKLISTMPLDRLLAMCGKNDITLPFTSVLVINIGAKKSFNTPTDHWVYVPFCKSGFYRLAFYTNVDKRRAPEGRVGMSVELAFPGNYCKDVIDTEKIMFEVINELQEWGFIGKVDVVDPTYVKTAYSWLHKEEDRTDALKWLNDRGIVSTGRYGKWKFQGMVQSIEDGLSL